MRETAWRIDFTEYERGWGSRPDGFTLYATKALADEAFRAHWDAYPDGEAPDYYIHASHPREVNLTVQQSRTMGDLNSCPFA